MLIKPGMRDVTTSMPLRHCTFWKMVYASAFLHSFMLPSAKGSQPWYFRMRMPFMYSDIILALLSAKLRVFYLIFIWMKPILPDMKVPMNMTKTPTSPTQPTSVKIRLSETTIMIGLVIRNEPY